VSVPGSGDAELVLQGNAPRGIRGVAEQAEPIGRADGRFSNIVVIRWKVSSRRNGSTIGAAAAAHDMRA
jgi:hypothetical protein